MANPAASGIRKAAEAHAGLIIAAILLLGFSVLAGEVTEGEMGAFDKAVLMIFRAGTNPSLPIGPSWLPGAVRDVTALGSYTVLTLVVAAVCIALSIRRRYGMALFVLLTVAGGSVINNSLKAIFDRPRPDFSALTEVFTSSFPSGHATVSAVAYLTLGACLARTTASRGLRIFYFGYAALLVLLVGLSRVYLGVHYPSDVLAGWAIGTAWALLCWAALTARMSWYSSAP